MGLQQGHTDPMIEATILCSSKPGRNRLVVVCAEAAPRRAKIASVDVYIVEKNG
jgi:hypothetical protein